jgi:hypothetical protein
MRREVITMFAALALVVPWATAQEPVPAPLEELETVLVLGEQPGPGLVKVSRDGHVMWVLATYGPLPKGMTWRTKEVEARLRESRELLLPPEVKVDADFSMFSLLTHIPSAYKAVTIPDGRKLGDVLPPATWRQWSMLSGRYGARSLDRLRPAFAIDALRERAYRSHQLEDGPEVVVLVRAIAKKQHVPIHKLPDVERVVKMKDLPGLLKVLAGVGLPDIGCFTESLGHLEGDIARMKMRANTWARGQLAALREMEGQPEIGSECDDEFELAVNAALEAKDSAAAARLKKLGADYDWHEEQATVQARRDWIAAARKALERNDVTFAVLPAVEVVGSRGYVAGLAALGYEVAEP